MSLRLRMERHAAMHAVHQVELPVAFEIGAGDLNVGIGDADVVLARERGAHAPVTVLRCGSPTP